jgi:hypothetical protein
MRALLEARGFANLADWSRGVDPILFNPDSQRFTELRRPVFLFVGRVAIEKNLAAFLALDLPGTKLVVGDGPQRAELERRFPDAVFAGVKRGVELASTTSAPTRSCFRAAPIPSGWSSAEAMACGTPVAAYPVRGPVDVVTDPAVGVLDNDLAPPHWPRSELDRGRVARFGERFSWEHSTRQFVSSLVPARSTAPELAGLPDAWARMTRATWRRSLRAHSRARPAWCASGTRSSIPARDWRMPGGTRAHSAGDHARRVPDPHCVHGSRDTWGARAPGSDGPAGDDRGAAQYRRRGRDRPHLVRAPLAVQAREGHW